MKALDSLDIDLLSELDQNSRQPLSNLAERLGEGREKLSYRLKRLEQSNIISRYTATVNPYRFGLIVYKTYVQLENNRKRITELIDKLGKHPRVYWHGECYGMWDAMFAISARNPKEFYSIQSSILSAFSDIIIEFNVYTIVEAWFFKKNYLRGVGTDYVVFGGEPKDYALTELDFDILKCLSANARTPSVEIAEKTGTSANTVRERIKKLEEQGVILGYRLELNLKTLGINLVKAQVHLQHYNEREADRLRDFCKMNPRLVLLVEQIGDCFFELEYEVESQEQFHSFVDELREQFPKYIRRVDSIMMRTENYKWMPYQVMEPLHTVRS